MNKNLKTPLVPVAKTIKLFIGGEFPRTESGRSYKVLSQIDPKQCIHLCLASRKDLRNSVENSKKALPSWKQKSAFNRSQILYRMAEIAEGRKEDFVHLATTYLGHSAEETESAFGSIIEAWIYYAGFCDKIEQTLSSANPVGTPFQNTTSVDSLGSVMAVAEEKSAIENVLAGLAAILALGNTVILLLPDRLGVFTSWLGEILATSDVTRGAINILSGDLTELLPHIGSHMEIDGIASFLSDNGQNASLKKASISNLKRMHVFEPHHVLGMDHILPFTEFKTLWVTQGF